MKSRGIESELEATSNRLGATQGNRVRSKGNFGQVGCTQVRAGNFRRLGDPRGIESELKVTSDRLGATQWVIESDPKATSDRLGAPQGNRVRNQRQLRTGWMNPRGIRVRTKGNFGQVGCTPGESSPN